MLSYFIDGINKLMIEDQLKAEREQWKADKQDLLYKIEQLENFKTTHSSAKSNNKDDPKLNSSITK